MGSPFRVLLISTYELGRQPFGLASPAAWLREAGLAVRCLDVAKEPLADAAVREAALVGFFLPMHTATRLAVPLIERVRRLNPSAHICCYGLYAPLNRELLRGLGVETILGGEFEAGLTALARRLEAGETERAQETAGGREDRVRVPRLAFRVPDRAGLPPLTRYAALQLAEGERRTAGYTEASRGCKHLCRHCPIVPVYEGQFRIVPVDVVMADVGAQVTAGARHITFGDPDFFNGIGHALAVVDRFAREFPDCTYDVTIKVEHLRKHGRHLEDLKRTGCLFVTTAVESVDDETLRRLDKGHTAADFEAVVQACRRAGLWLAPTFVPFTPWTTPDQYRTLLDRLEALELVEQVAPIQLSIRLLIPAGSKLMELGDVRELVDPFDPQRLVYPWRHPDPEVDRLQQEVSDTVGRQVSATRTAVFGRIRELAGGRIWTAPAGDAPGRPRATVPYLNEPWYC